MAITVVHSDSGSSTSDNILTFTLPGSGIEDGDLIFLWMVFPTSNNIISGAGLWDNSAFTAGWPSGATWTHLTGRVYTKYLTTDDSVVTFGLHDTTSFRWGYIIVRGVDPDFRGFNPYDWTSGSSGASVASAGTLVDDSDAASYGEYFLIDLVAAMPVVDTAGLVITSDSGLDVIVDEATTDTPLPLPAIHIIAGQYPYYVTGTSPTITFSITSGDADWIRSTWACGWYIGEDATPTTVDIATDGGTYSETGVDLSVDAPNWYGWQSHWYMYVPASDGTLTIDTSASSWDTWVNVYADDGRGDIYVTPPTPSGLWIGGSTNSPSSAWSSFDALSTRNGPFYMHREYDSGLPGSWSTGSGGDHVSADLTTGKYMPWASVKCTAAQMATTPYKSDVHALAASLPAGAFFTWRHEPENDSEFSSPGGASLFVSGFQDFYTAAKAGNPDLIVLPVYMAYQWRNYTSTGFVGLSGDPGEDWYVGDAYCDAIGVDYYYDTAGRGTPILTMETDPQFTDGFWAWYSALHIGDKPWAVAEHGISPDPGDATAKGAAYTDNANFMAANNGIALMFWSSTLGIKDYTNDEPATVTAMQAIAAAGRTS